MSEGETTSTARADVTVVPGPISNVVVEPSEVTMNIGVVQQFSFGAFDQFENELAGVISSWIVAPDIGSIDSEGVLITGTTAGEFPGAVQIEVVHGEAKVTGAADLDIRPDPLFSVNIEPVSAIVRPGATQRFTATGLDFFGNPIPDLDFAWEATGGVIERLDARTADFHGGAGGSRYEVKASTMFLDNARTGMAVVGVPPGWMPAGNMAAPRSGHAAVLLDDGKVLIVGGRQATAELYDPASKTFTLLGSVPFRSGVRAIKLTSGSVLVVGAGGVFPEATAMIYDPTTRQFSATGGLNFARAYSSVTLLPDGKVLVAGGQEHVAESRNQTVAVAELYDPDAAQFTVTGSLNEHRSGHAAARLRSGKVLIVGGTQTTEPGYGFGLNIAETFDPAIGDFVVTAQTDLAWPTLVMLNDGRVLLLRGTLAEVFDPATNSFSRTDDTITPHSAPTATLMPDGRVLVTGDGGNSEVELYDPVTGSFSSHSSLPEARQAHTATLLPSGVVLIIGGYATSEGTLDSAILYIH